MPPLLQDSVAPVSALLSEIKGEGNGIWNKSERVGKRKIIQVQPSEDKYPSNAPTMEFSVPKLNSRPRIAFADAESEVAVDSARPRKRMADFVPDVIAHYGKKKEGENEGIEIKSDEDIDVYLKKRDRDK